MTVPTQANPPAFPRDHRYEGHNGLTTRAYMATQILSGMATGPWPRNSESQEMARRAVMLADHLMEALR